MVEFLHLGFTRMPSGVTVGNSGLCCSYVPCLSNPIISLCLLKRCRQNTRRGIHIPCSKLRTNLHCVKKEQAGKRCLECGRHCLNLSLRIIVDDGLVFQKQERQKVTAIHALAEAQGPISRKCLSCPETSISNNTKDNSGKLRPLLPTEHFSPRPPGTAHHNFAFYLFN